MFASRSELWALLLERLAHFGELPEQHCAGRLGVTTPTSLRLQLQCLQIVVACC